MDHTSHFSHTCSLGNVDKGTRWVTPGTQRWTALCMGTQALPKGTPPYTKWPLHSSMFQVIRQGVFLVKARISPEVKKQTPCCARWGA
eukprot:1143328-Pelagomonas_calceolata.AAC.5